MNKLSIVIPTYNESGNVGVLIAALQSALGATAWEAIFVDDDSPDATAALLREAAQRDPRIRVIHRIGRRGLSSACIEGVLSASAPYICVMDADLQHDEQIIPEMLKRLEAGGIDIVIGSRYTGSGSHGDLPAHRARISRLATLVSTRFTGLGLSDPMSGFFMFTRPFFESVMRRLSGRGFKILLDIMMSAPPPVAYAELPYRMRSRRSGESKLSPGVIWDFAILLLHKTLGRLLPARFISFAAVGCGGLLVHLLVLWLVYEMAPIPFAGAQAVATLVAMTSNFFFNNLFTYNDRQLRGAEFLLGLLSFYAICAFGALINVALADWLFALSGTWWLAGIAGALAGAIWNYYITALLTWRTPSP